MTGMDTAQPPDPHGPEDRIGGEDNIREKKKMRKRRKRIFNEIRDQIEFYFSDSNLRNDQYMKQLMVRSSEGGQLTGREAVALSQIVSFNKIKALSANEEEIRRAIRGSTLLQVTSDGSCVRRLEPVDFHKDVDACTLYVENLPNDVTHEWLKSLFSSHGKVTYVSIPKFKDKRTKGFAFIEFSSEEAVSHVCKTFGAQAPHLSPGESVNASVSRLQANEAGDVPAEKNTKRKNGPEESAERIAKKVKEDTNKDAPNSDRQLSTRSRLELQEDVALKLDASKLNLRVMSKQEWSDWKRKYRRLQIENMKNVKNAIKSAAKPEEAAVPSAVASKLANLINPSQLPTIPAKSNSFDLQPGSIVRLAIQKKAGEAFEDALVKRCIRQAADPIRLAYIDMDSSHTQFLDDQTVMYVCFVRCSSHADAVSLCDRKAFQSLGSAAILTGEEEKKYQERIRESRVQQELKQQNKNRKGFRKWLHRAEHVVESVPDTVKE